MMKMLFNSFEFLFLYIAVPIFLIYCTLLAILLLNHSFLFLFYITFGFNVSSTELDTILSLLTELIRWYSLLFAFIIYLVVWFIFAKSVSFVLSRIYLVFLLGDNGK